MIGFARRCPSVSHASEPRRIARQTSPTLSSASLNISSLRCCSSKRRSAYCYSGRADRYEDQVRLHLIPHLGRLRLERLGPGDVQRGGSLRGADWKEQSSDAMSGGLRLLSPALETGRT
jgi:hypothetical protein